MATARELLPTAAAPSDDAAHVAAILRSQSTWQAGPAAALLTATTRHALAAPGKLLRPTLLLEACRAVGGDPALVDSAAAGTELGHVASLIHDDIIDGDDLRRGQETVHKRFGEAAAILTGDLFIFQMFQAYTTCCERGIEASRVVEAIRILSTTCVELCQGQALEAALTGHLDATEPAYLEVIRLKTASVCRAAAEIGGCLGGGSTEQVQALAGYGENVGMAFQIVDDLLCYEGEADAVGKPLDSDLRNARMTLPLIYALASGDSHTRKQVAKLLGGAEADAHQRLTRIVSETGALQRARLCAYQYTDRASRHLDELPLSAARERLRLLSEGLLVRGH